MSNKKLHARVRGFGQLLVDKAKDEYYATPDSRIHTIVGGASDYFVRLRKVKAEWDQRWKAGYHESNFPQYLEETYGIKMKMDDSGIDIAYDIIDEKKHTLFLLKFGA